MPIICPTITAFGTQSYREQIERIKPFSERIHIDLMDGEFAPTISPGLSEVWWPPLLIADIHLMYERPMEQIDELVRLRPNLVVIHQETVGNHVEFADQLRQAGIKAGLAVLHDTPIEQIFETMQSFDHILIFSGDLGHHGGTSDTRLLDKVRAVRERQPTVEIGWDGGVNDLVAPILLEGGVDVLNVGGYIQRADNPENAYAKLKEIKITPSSTEG